MPKMICLHRCHRWSYSTTVLLLLAVFCPVAADVSKMGAARSDAAPPTLARLSFWVPPERMAEFEVAYEERAVPVLEQHGLVVSTRRGRTTADSVFSRLFDMETPTDIAATATALQKDPAWQEVLQRWGGRFGAAGADESIRPSLLALYDSCRSWQSRGSWSGEPAGIVSEFWPDIWDWLSTRRLSAVILRMAGAPPIAL